MNILMAFDDGYVMPSKVMLKSLILNNAPHIYIYILHRNALSEESIRSVKALEDGERVFISFICVDEKEVFSKFPVDRYPLEAYYRLFAQSFLDESVERILWLDGDMIINGSLKDFYEQDFGDKLYIAVEDMCPAYNEEESRKIHDKLRMPQNQGYINSGVMLLNLKEIKKRINNNEIIEYIRTNSELLACADQDVFNGLLYPYIKIVDPEFWYNYSAVFIWSRNKKDVYRNAHVIHYAGPEKPWRRGCPNNAFDLWWKYARLTDDSLQTLYSEVRPSHMRENAKRETKLLLRACMPRLYQTLRDFKNKHSEAKKDS